MTAATATRDRLLEHLAGIIARVTTPTSSSTTPTLLRRASSATTRQGDPPPRCYVCRGKKWGTLVRAKVVVPHVVPA